MCGPGPHFTLAAGDAAYLDLTAGVARIECGLADGRRPAKKRAVTNIELGAVARAGNDVAVEVAVAEHAAAVPTTVVDCIDTSVVSSQQHRCAVRFRGPHFPIRQVRSGAHGGPILRSAIERSLVNADTTHVGHVPAQVSTAAEHTDAGQSE